MFFGFENLKNLVIDRGLCTGCGTCIGVCPRECLEIGYEHDEPMPSLVGECRPCGICYSACPGAEVPVPELDKFCFGRVRGQSEDLGIFSHSAAGYATDDKIRTGGSSGGVATALLIYALEKGIIDCALVAGFSKETPWRTEARVATTSEEVIEAAQSKYSMVSTNSLLNKAIKSGYKKIGIVGLPCHIHGIRKIQYRGLVPYLTQKVEFLLGLFCGSEFYFEATRHLLTEWCGVDNLGEVKAIQYRGGSWPGDFIVDLKSGERNQIERHIYIQQVLTRYRKDRCMMCVDWSAEFADISFADFWDPKMKRGDLGKTAMLVRTPKGIDLVEGAQHAGHIAAEPCSTDYLVAAAGFEQKKHANSFRLRQRQRFGWPTPNFSFQPSYAPLPMTKQHIFMPSR